MRGVIKCAAAFCTEGSMLTNAKNVGYSYQGVSNRHSTCNRDDGRGSRVDGTTVPFLVFHHDGGVLLFLLTHISRSLIVGVGSRLSRLKRCKPSTRWDNAKNTLRYFWPPRLRVCMAFYMKQALPQEHSFHHFLRAFSRHP